MPKSFDLTCKGYCPHFFNTASNLNYVGPYSEPKFYGTGFMSVDERAQFMQWHQEQKGKLFSNKDELVAYCMDVNVLRKACCAFRNLFLKMIKMDPFREAIAISSVCNKVFRTMLLKPHAVGIIPRADYRMGIISLLKVIKKSKTLVTLFFPSGGEFRKLLRNTPGL